MGKIRLLVLLGVFVLVFGFVQFKEGKAGTNDNISGWAWSETIGWISFNSTNCDTDGDGTYEGANEAGDAAPAGCPVSGTVRSYGVNVDWATGALSGYAWSEHIGWIKSNPTTTPPGEASAKPAKLDFTAEGTVCGVQHNACGWVRACTAVANKITCEGIADANAGGWDGWIKLRGQTTQVNPRPYGVSWEETTQELQGWAWGSDVVGWLNFDRVSIADERPPTSFIDAPDPANWLRRTTSSNHYYLKTTDEDLESGLDTSQCAFEVCVYVISDAGTSTGSNSSTTLNDTNKLWYANDWQNGTVVITSGTGSGQTRTVSSNTATRITVSSAWTTTPDVTSVYSITAPSRREHCTNSFSRTCNIVDNSREILVGPQQQCTARDQANCAYCNFEGRNACDIFVSAIDRVGNVGESSESYNVDWTFPSTSKLFITSSLADQTYPIVVADGAPFTYQVHATDNVEVAYCFLYIDSVAVDNNSDGNPDLMEGQPGCTLEDCVFELGVSLPAPGGDNTYSNNYAVCFDASSLGRQGQAVDITVETLDVALEAIPAQGSIHTNFDLKATVSGAATGNINYKFDCTNDETWELEVSNSATNPYTAADVCQYDSPGTYTAKVLVQRGIGSAENTLDIVVSANSVPSTTNRSVDAHNATDYCGVTGYPPVRVHWAFSDADAGDTQGAYELEVFQGADKVVDTGKKSGATQSYVFQSAGEQLLWNTTYTWQVRVWDSPNDDVSSFASGPQFTTVAHHYPAPDFTWIPALPGAQESVQFTDQTNFDEGGVNNSQPSINQNWSWAFGDGGSSTSQNPTHTYAQTGAFGVTLQSGDDVGSCSNQDPVIVNVTAPFPEWQEISPF